MGINQWRINGNLLYICLDYQLILYTRHVPVDMSPSDVGLQGILEMLPVWEEYAISLGLTIKQMEYYQGLPQRPIRGLLALEYWRDGQCGPSYPCTWRFLLDVIKDRLGPNVAEDLRKKVANNKTWTISSPTGWLCPQCMVTSCVVKPCICVCVCIPACVLCSY